MDSMEKTSIVQVKTDFGTQMVLWYQDLTNHTTLFGQNTHEIIDNNYLSNILNSYAIWFQGSLRKETS